MLHLHLLPTDLHSLQVLALNIQKASNIQLHKDPQLATPRKDTIDEGNENHDRNLGESNITSSTLDHRPASQPQVLFMQPRVLAGVLNKKCVG
ncbi:hypothetical protein LTR67_003765 [Exophiala xenobiotica]